MTYKSAPGFHERLLDAMHSNGFSTAEDLAAAINISVPQARILMRSSTPTVDAVTIFRICDKTHFSGRWLINGTLPTTLRTVTDPDEQRLLEILRAVPAEQRDQVYDRILAVIHEQV